MESTGYYSTDKQEHQLGSEATVLCIDLARRQPKQFEVGEQRLMSSRAVGLPPLKDHNAWADYWRNVVGVNVIPAQTRAKKIFVEWKQWQNQPIPDEVHERWKSEGKFNDGMAIICGKVWRGQHAGKYFNFIDCDNKKAIDEICAALGYNSLIDMSRFLIIEQHADDPTRAHIYVYSDVPFIQKGSDVNVVVPTEGQTIDVNEIPYFEVKGEASHGMAFCTPSFHKKGHRYNILGVSTTQILPEAGAKYVMECIDSICKKHGLHYLGDGIKRGGGIEVSELFKEDAVIYEGNNRHLGLLKMTMSLVARLYGRTPIPLSTIKDMAGIVLNQKHCRPPLDRDEFERNVWRSVKKYVATAGTVNKVEESD
jgi:Bifunctional DNA primase/polymerase, N-terminal